MERGLFLFYFSISYVRACYKKSERQIILASELYFIEYTQIFNQTGVRVETESWMLNVGNPRISIKPLTDIRIGAAQIIDEHAVFISAFTETSPWFQNFRFYNVSSKVVGTNLSLFV